MKIKQTVLIVGGGVIGLSVAWELSQRGYSVILLEKHRIGRKASWAGAGILAPANSSTATQPIDKLLGLGSDLHVRWHQQLLDATGIDNKYRECGGIYLAFTAGDRAALSGQQMNWSEYNIVFEELESGHPCLEMLSVQDHWKILSVPGESQICNPTHLKTLQHACRRAGVRLVEDVGDLDFEIEASRIVTATTATQRFEADHICFCAGAWTQKLLEPLGIRLPTIPVRGQMLMFKLDQLLCRSIINVGPRYIVPREDGHVLVGATLEEVGFDESTTTNGLQDLQTFAESVCPVLNVKRRIRQWAGLRPATYDGFPFMGKLAGRDNISVACGHFKSGLQMSPAVATIMADLIESKDTIMDISPFDPSRLDFNRDIDASFGTGV